MWFLICEILFIPKSICSSKFLKYDIHQVFDGIIECTGMVFLTNISMKIYQCMASFLGNSFQAASLPAPLDSGTFFKPSLALQAPPCWKKFSRKID